MRLNRWLALGLVIVTGLPLVAGGQGGAARPTTKEGSSVVGQVEPSERVDVPSMLRGQLIQIGVQEGQPIKKGQVIGQLDDEIQRQTVALARLESQSTVEVRASENQVAYARNELERFQRIAASVAPLELRQKELTLQQSELELERRRELTSKRRIELARESATLDRMTIRSPLDGVVLRIHKQVGEMVEMEKPFAVVVQTRTLHVRFYAPRQLFGKVKVGDKIPVEVKTDQPLTREATVIAVDPVLDAAAGLFQVKVTLNNQDGAIPAGTSVAWNWK